MVTPEFLMLMAPAMMLVGMLITLILGQTIMHKDTGNGAILILIAAATTSHMTALVLAYLAGGR